MKCIVFDLYGDYGHFKKYYTTSSPLTFSFPPPPTMQGIVGAILGLPKESYHDLLESAKLKIGVSIQSPIRHIRVTYNHINTKGNNWTIVNGRIQIRTELLCDPKYRMYVSFDSDDVYSKFKEMIKQHKTVFSVSLGLSEFLANFAWVEEVDIEPKKNCDGEILTVFPLTSLQKDSISLEPGKRYQKEHVPIHMNSDRIVSLYEDVLFESTGQTLHASIKNGYRLQNGKYIYLF